MNAIEYMQQELQTLKEHSNLRRLPQLTHEGRTVIADGRHMLNLSSNDYLGLAADRQLKEEFLQTLTPDTFLPTSSSSRLLTGNFGIYEELETELATLFGTETALVLNSGYHANMGILPAVGSYNFNSLVLYSSFQIKLHKESNFELNKEIFLQFYFLFARCFTTI